jgi:hypothetical protein
VSPTIWAEGRIVGGWAQRADGEVAYRLLRDVGSEAERQVADQAAELAEFLGPVRLSARARALSPLERELRD